MEKSFIDVIFDCIVLVVSEDWISSENLKELKDACLESVLLGVGDKERSYIDDLIRLIDRRIKYGDVFAGVIK